MTPAKPAGSLRDIVLSELGRGLWHSTHPTWFARILSDGTISPEPDIPDNERFGTAIGPEGYPYVRSIGGVSLFDLTDFEPATYSDLYRSSSWDFFIPFRRDWSQSIWIEIDRRALGTGFISGAALLAQWKRERASRRIMPLIEAAHIGAIHRNTFIRAFQVTDGDEAIVPLDLSPPCLRVEGQT